MLKFVRQLLQRKASAPEQASFAQAMSSMEANDFQRAAALFSTLAASDSHNAALHHQLAIAQARTGQLDAALLSAERALQLDAKAPGYRMVLANVLTLKGDLNAAHQALEDEIRSFPANARGHVGLARLLRIQGQRSAAIEALDKALALSPSDDDAAITQAELYMLEQQFAQAVTVLDVLLTREPSHVRARLLMGDALRSQFKMAAAERVFRSVLHDEPDNVIALTGLGVIMILQARGNEAEAFLRMAYGIAPDNIAPAKSLVSLLLEMRKVDAARDIVAALAHEYPQDAEFCTNLASLAHLDGDDARAAQLFERAMELAPNSPYSMEKYANLMAWRGDYADAVAMIERILDIAPGRAMSRYNLAMYRMILGDYERGLEGWESRLDLAYDPMTPYGARALFYPLCEAVKHIPRWHGDPAEVRGKRVLVWREQGLGDCLMTFRFIEKLRHLDPAHISVLADPPLARLVRHMPSVDRVITTTEWESEAWRTRSDAFDLQCSQMSLPWLLQETPQTFGNNVPYLHAPKADVAAWQSRFADITGLKVGLVWSGNPGLDSDKRRSIPLREFAPIAALPGVQLISLQKGPGQAQIADSGLPLIDHMDACTDFMDTAAMILALDMVISVDTSVAHLAGALGKPVWLLNRSGSEWRWMINREDSPWYPQMRLFNQQFGESWTTVLARLKDALAERSASH